MRFHSNLICFGDKFQGRAMAPALSYKKNYKVSPALQLFYTGGPVVVSGDTSFVACACTDDVKIVDLATGAVTKTLKGDTEPITALALSSDGRSLFAASRSLQIKHWDLPSETCLRAWKVMLFQLILSCRSLNYLQGVAHPVSNTGLRAQQF